MTEVMIFQNQRVTEQPIILQRPMLIYIIMNTRALGKEKTLKTSSG